GVNALRPTLSQLLGHTSTSKLQPRTVEPNTILVCARHPNHHGCRVHRLAKSLIKPAGALRRNVSELLIKHFANLHLLALVHDKINVQYALTSARIWLSHAKRSQTVLGFRCTASTGGKPIKG